MEPAPRDQDPWLALLLEDWFSPQQGLASASTQGSGLGLPTILEHPKAVPGGKAAPPVPPAPTPKRRKVPSPRLIRQLVDSGADGSESEADDSAVDASLTELVERFRLTLAGQSLPISLDYMSGPNVEETLADLISTHCVDRFYIGATQAPPRRWLGGWNDARDDRMPGHCERWRCMFMIGLQKDAAARRLETRLIVWAQERWPHLCANVAADSRGQCAGPNWVYVCF